LNKEAAGCEQDDDAITEMAASENYALSTYTRTVPLGR
jgi:hypothetical protein